MNKVIAAGGEILTLPSHELDSNLATSHCFALSILSGCNRLNWSRVEHVQRLQSRHVELTGAESNQWLHHVDSWSLRISECSFSITAGRNPSKRESAMLEEVVEPAVPLEHIGHALKQLEKVPAHNNGFFIGNMYRSDTNRNHAIMLKRRGDIHWQLFDSLNFASHCTSLESGLQLQLLAQTQPIIAQAEHIQTCLLSYESPETISIRLRFFRPMENLD